MTVEPSYRYCPDPKFPTCMEMRCEVCDGEGYVLDGRLQAIAEAWNQYCQAVSYVPRNMGAESRLLDKVFALLGALGGTDE